MTKDQLEVFFTLLLEGTIVNNITWLDSIGLFNILLKLVIDNDALFEPFKPILLALKGYCEVKMRGISIVNRLKDSISEFQTNLARSFASQEYQKAKMNILPIGSSSEPLLTFKF